MSYFDNLILLAMAQGENSPIATKEYVDDIIDARSDSSLIPTSANTTGKMKFVILSSIPETRYDGYMYIITEA